MLSCELRDKFPILQDLGWEGLNLVQELDLEATLIKHFLKIYYEPGIVLYAGDTQQARTGMVSCPKGLLSPMGAKGNSIAGTQQMS